MAKITYEYTIIHTKKHQKKHTKLAKIHTNHIRFTKSLHVLYTGTNAILTIRSFNPLRWWTV